MSFKVDHFAFQVSDLQRSIEFYTTRLGLRFLFQDLDEEHHEAFAFLQLDGANLELLQRLDENNRPIPLEIEEIASSYCPHIALTTENIDTLILDLQSKNISVVKGPLEITGKVRWLYIADPDNRIIEFVQWL